MNQDVQVLENAAEEVAVNPGLNAKHKGLIIGAVALTGGLAIGGILLFKHLKAKKSTKLLQDKAEEKTEENE